MYKYIVLIFLILDIYNLHIGEFCRFIYSNNILFLDDEYIDNNMSLVTNTII